MIPNFPIIIFYNNALDLIPSEENLCRTSLLGMLEGNQDSKAYDNDGNVWELKLLSEKFKDNFTTRFLAHTIYNPQINVTPKWSTSGKYNLSELKNMIQNVIDNDDDIFTQFVEAKILNELIENANNFQEVYKIILQNVFEFKGE
jgi:hypothetical protein